MPDYFDNKPALNMPGSPEEIDPDWLQQALKPEFPEVLVERAAAERLGEGYGLASSIIRYRWETGEPPHSVVVKLWPTNGPGGIREALFYHAFGKAVGARIPACYFAGLDLDKQRGALILEDPGAVVQGDYLQKLSEAQATALARKLAAVHATWMGHEALEKAAWLPSTGRWERGPEWFEARRALFLERFGDRLDAQAKALLDQIENGVGVANERLEGATPTLLHADLHQDNLIFTDSMEPLILDWAGCTQGPLALDLYELLFPMIQDTSRERVSETYMEAFKATAGEELDTSILWRQLGGVFLRKFAAATCGTANWEPASARETALIETGLQRASQALRYFSQHDPGLFSFL